MTSGNSVIIGQISAPHGVKGWMHVRSFTEPQSNLKNFLLWELYFKNKKTKFVQVEQFRDHNDHFVVKLKDVEDREAAALFTNCEIAVERNLLPELESGECYLADLLGMTVYNTVGEKKCLGVVTDFLQTGANDILIITGEKKYLIPCIIGEHVLNICLNKKEIQVAWDAEF